MRFEFDHKTGMMRPKKDEEIYFAQSQGGGLIVDDKKNNIKYIIERDGRITKLFGSFDKNNLNLYDMRDARIIADRVRRLLGRDHKYSDFHYFLRGYRMSESFIKTCSDFLGESIWSDIQDRSSGDTVRKEDIITTNEDLKNRILGLYKEQGWGDTLDVSSLRNCIKCDDFSYIFCGYEKVKHIIGLEDWDVSNVKDMFCMFWGCKKFNSDLSKWDVSNVENMRYMFKECEKFSSDLSKWNVSKVENMEDMFYGCKKFNSDLSKWNVSSVGDMNEMFEGCEKFNSDLSNWDVRSVEHMGSMFCGCKKFNSDLSKWNVSGVRNMNFMFWGCEKFNSDLSNWDVSSVGNMQEMFKGCKNFNCDLSKWNVKGYITFGSMFINMFDGCDSLKNKPSWYMKKQSKITESIWSDIQDRSSGEVIRKEDGVKVHTCIDVDIYLKNVSDSYYDDLIKEILNYNDSYVNYKVGILSVRDKAYSTEEMKNMRAFEAPYAYLIYDGRYGSSLVAEFWTYDEMKDFDLDDFEDRICEEDYISICKGIATKLKEVGDSIEYLPRDISYIGNKKNNMNYDGDYALQLIGESDVNNWEVEYVDKYGKGSTSTSLEDFKEDMIYAFPELDDVEFITWSYNKYACNIGIPITATTVKNFKKYKEYTKNWFTIDEEAE